MKNTRIVTGSVTAATLLLILGCSALQPPPRLSPTDPADPKAPESTQQSEAPVLRPPEGAGRPASSHAHGEHASHEASTPAPSYSCPMHPEVKSDQPGKCSQCGMRLVQAKPPGNTP